MKRSRSGTFWELPSQDGSTDMHIEPIPLQPSDVLIPKGNKMPKSTLLEWILLFPSQWTLVTMNFFYTSLGENSLSKHQLRWWLTDFYAISLELVSACKRISIVLDTQAAHELLDVARRDAQEIGRTAISAGLQEHNGKNYSPKCKRLTNFIAEKTGRDMNVPYALTSVLTYTLSLWQSWNLVKSKFRSFPAPFQSLSAFLTRTESICAIFKASDYLDSLLEPSPAYCQKFAASVFDGTLDRIGAVLRFIDGVQEDPTRCACGRMGHSTDECVFRSHI